MTSFKRDFNFDKSVNEIISKNIRKYRKQAKVTQEQLALDVDKSYDFIRRLEFKKGEIGCSLDTIYRISVVLGVPLNKLFIEDEKVKTKS